jgi:hypothetical protein
LSRNKGEEKVAYRPPVPPPLRPERPEEGKWPSPTPLPAVPVEDTSRLLKQILDRLDSIEKRLERIEKALMDRQPVIT